MVGIYRCSLYVLCAERKYKSGQHERCCSCCEEYQPLEPERVPSLP
jgi:hypothetical protein